MSRKNMRAKALARFSHLLKAPHLAEKPVDEMSSGEARRMLIGSRAGARPEGPAARSNPSTSLDLFAQHELRETVAPAGARRRRHPSSSRTICPTLFRKSTG